MKGRSIPTRKRAIIENKGRSNLCKIRTEHRVLRLTLLLLLLAFLFFFPAYLMGNQSSWETLFSDDFEVANNYWDVTSDWRIIEEAGNHYLRGSSNWGTNLRLGEEWTDYSFKFRIKILKGEAFFNFRMVSAPFDHTRYRVNFRQDGLSLSKETSGGNFEHLSNKSCQHSKNKWYEIEISAIKNTIKIYVGGALRLTYRDSSPLSYGTVGFEVLENSEFCFDDVVITGEIPEGPNKDFTWVRTGGPSGGLGYDVRIHPTDPSIMFVTDNPSGVNKSYDNGRTWVQRNNGITARSGASMDAIPIFSLTIDPNDPNIVWAGLQYLKGIYKSTDCGETWVKKDNGVVEGDEISFRGFAIHPQNSNIVFAAAEISTPLYGKTFEKTKGKIYKTTDGGENWRCVWEGENLARFVLFDYNNPETLYASTGIFDREAYNDIGVGVLRSTDGGENCSQINNGLESLYIGFLEMHPDNPKILYAAAGENAYFNNCGVYKTIDGGAHWTKILGEEVYFVNKPYPFNGDSVSVVTVSPSNPKVVYAGSGTAFFRSDDEGDTWSMYNQGFGWGPPGLQAGQPISAVVVPNDPMTVFVNNYAGGNFKSTDGGETWIDASEGYTGAESLDIAMDRNHPNIVYAIGRSGPFRSSDYGNNWAGIAFDPARETEWAVALNPSNSQELLISAGIHSNIYKSIDGGNRWRLVLSNLCDPEECKFDESKCHGFADIAYAPSNPNIVYAGAKGYKYEIYAEASLGMYKSIDGGENWVAINNGLQTPIINIHCIAVHPGDPDTVYIGTWQDGVFKTTDGGRNWVNKSSGLVSADVRSLAIDPKNPQIIYAGLGEGAGIVKSIDGANSWSENNRGIDVTCPSYLLNAGEVAEGTSFERPRNFATRDYYSVPWTSVWAIVIDPVNPQVIYAGDHNKGIYRSANGGESWDLITNGLSTRAVTAMDISADGSIIYAATEGGGVFRWSKEANLIFVPDGDLAPFGNRDGQVNVGDALVALRLSLGLETISQEDMQHGDVAPLDTYGYPEPDGKMTVGDALVILRRALGIIQF